MPSHLLPALAQSQKEADEAATAKEKEDEKKKKKVRREGGSYTDPAHYNGGRNAQKYDVFGFRTTTEVLLHMLCSWQCL